MNRRVAFQSTLPRGERQDTEAGKYVIRDFNPRSREGSDENGLGPDKRQTISIHAPARGATGIGTAVKKSAAISIHAPARGATLAAVLVYKAGEISIHAPARGATRP